jgi:hypothetical protein
VTSPQPPRSVQELLDLVDEAGYASEIDWTKGIADAGRISIERMISAGEVARTQASHGLIRLSGEGVVGHSASANEVASVIASFQRLVTAVGASLASGNTSLRGQIASGLANRTRLRLVASPAPGSLVLNLSPQAPPAEETMPGGAAPLFQEAEPLADQAVSVIVSLMSDASQLGPDPDNSPLLQQIEALGPRSAAAMRTFALALSTGDFDTDIGWQVPTQPSLRASVDRDHAAEIARLVESRNLDAEQIEIIGELRTISDLSAWVIDGDDSERYQVDARFVPPETAGELHIHMRVRIQAEMTPTRHVGGAFRYTFIARQVEAL